MEKDVLKKTLLKVFKLEEGVVRIYVEKLPAIMQVFIDQKALKEAEDLLKVMVKNSEHHRNTCQNILSMIDMDPRHDF